MKATRVVIYLADGATHHGVPLYTSIMDFLFHSDIAGASVFKGIAGFGAAHRMHASHILDISDHLPVRIEFVDTSDKINAVLPEIEKRTSSGLITVEEVSTHCDSRRH